MKSAYFLLLLLYTQTFYGQNNAFNNPNNVINTNVQNSSNKLQGLQVLYEMAVLKAESDTLVDFESFIQHAIIESRHFENEFYETLFLKILAVKYFKLGDLKKSNKKIDDALNLYKNRKGDSLMITLIKQKADQYRFFEDNDSSLVFYNKALKLALDHNNKYLLATVYSGLASLNINYNHFEEAIKFEQKSLLIANETSNKNLQLSSQLGLGWLFIKIGDYKKSLKYLLKAEILINNNSKFNKKLECDLYRFMGLNLSRRGEIKQANDYNKRALNCLESIGELLLSADVSNTIGANLLREGRYLDAIPYFENLIINAKQFNSKSIENFGIINLSSALIETKQLTKGEEILLEVLKDTTNRVDLSKNLEKVAYQNLSEIYRRSASFEKSLNFYKKFRDLNDTIINKSKHSEVTEIETKYQTEKKEKENLKLIAEKAEQQMLIVEQSKRTWQLTSALILSILGFGVFFYFFQRNKKQIFEIQLQKNRIENLQKELHHRVKNNLAIIDTFIEVTKEEFPGQAYETKLSELQNRINSINSVHEQLYNNQDVTALSVKAYLSTLTKNISSSYNKPGITIHQSVPESLTLQADKSFPVGLIVNEFVTNSYKYGFKNIQKGMVTIFMTENEQDYELTLKDNGIGLPKVFNLNDLDSFGMRIMQLLSKQLDGTFNLASVNGVQLTVKFPK